MYLKSKSSNFLNVKLNPCRDNSSQCQLPVLIAIFPIILRKNIALQSHLTWLPFFIDKGHWMIGKSSLSTWLRLLEYIVTGTQPWHGLALIHQTQHIISGEVLTSQFAACQTNILQEWFPHTCPPCRTLSCLLHVCILSRDNVHSQVFLVSLTFRYIQGIFWGNPHYKQNIKILY